jgi:pimeloyl-ACP methyl ester carboxylesterase
VTTLLGLHGFTQNGPQLHMQLSGLARRLPTGVELVCPDAPHGCSQASIDRMYRGFGRRPPGPYLCWWDANQDGSVYTGWESSLEQLRQLAVQAGPLALLGFSQGAMMASALAALSVAGQFPALACVVLVAGRSARSSLLQPLFARPIAVPSLHVWGERDLMMRDGSAALVEAFDPHAREVVHWPGPHAVPRRGPAADSIVDFITRQIAER